MNVADMLVKGLQLTPENTKMRVKPVVVDCCCAITGDRITSGYPAQKVVSNNTGEFLQLLSGDVTGYLSLEAALAFKGSWNMGSRLIFADGTMYHPLFSAENAAKQERACWSSLVREVWPQRQGQEVLVIIAEDYKKKIWPLAKVGTLGAATPVLLFYSDTLAAKTVSWPELLTTLDLVELCYAANFSKKTIASNLFSDYNRCMELGITQAMQWERTLENIRSTPEFDVAVAIAQR